MPRLFTAVVAFVLLCAHPLIAVEPMKGKFTSAGVTGQTAREHGWKRQNVYLTDLLSGESLSALTDEGPAGPFAFALLPASGDVAFQSRALLFGLSHSDIAAFSWRQVTDPRSARADLELASPAHYSVMYDRGAEEWGDRPHLSGDDFYQTFVATSRHITRIATRIADKSGDHHHLTLNYAVYETNDGPPSTWKCISPVRSRFLSEGTDPIIHIFHVAFRSQEVELQPGKLYAVRLWRDPKSQSERFAILSRRDTGDGYRSGHAWQGDQPVKDQDLFAYVSGGEPGTLVNYAPLGDLETGARLAGSAARFGQTFRATGKSLLAVESIYTTGQASPDVLAVSYRVYDRPGGTPIGPVRTGRGLPLAFQARAAAAWMPGEVPLVPGNMYYLEWTSRETNTWVINEDLPGQAYKNGTPMPEADLLITLVEEDPAAVASPGGGRARAEPDGPQRFRLPAPLEDGDPLIEEPVFGACAGHVDTDATLEPMEWVAKRTWHLLGFPYNRKDFTGPPNMKSTFEQGWVVAEGTVVDAGVPLRNQVITCEVRQENEPLLVLLRSTDAFGEVHVQLDLIAGEARAYSVTVSRSMLGGKCGSSPRPEAASMQPISSARFEPLGTGPVSLRIRTQGDRIAIRAGDRDVFTFIDPDPAGGKFGFGSVGRMRVRHVQQWELITEREQQRRAACIADMHAFCKQIDSHYADDVRSRNRVESREGELLWTWPATGATARLRVEGPRIRGQVRAGLYGDDVLIDGAFPEIAVTAAGGEVYGPDPGRQATISGDPRRIDMSLPLRSASGHAALARIRAELTVQTVWFWTVDIQGVQAESIRARLDLAPAFRPAQPISADDKPVVSLLRHNARNGIFVKLIEPDRTRLGTDAQGTIELVSGDRNLRFATVVLPAQPLNLVGFKHRMVHFIRYPEGPIQHWRRLPSFQEYPDDVDLARYAGHGTDAMVWHHTWVNSDFRDREGFLLNHDEMSRAMNETHRLGMKTICYLGIVPGRSSLLRFEDLSPRRGERYGRYEKNWDLQDQTFYHLNGRYPEYIVWMADYWCKTYDIDGFYLDGGCFGIYSHGPDRKPLHAEDAGLSLDELQHRTYYRIRKVLELNGARYGLEPWSGLDWMLNGFYDCMMIGESFQEAPPEYYRDGHNTLLTGCTVKMYGMRESSQNPYNIAMAAVTLGDIQVCSGNGAWGDDPDTTDTWARVRPLWDLLDSIEWDRLVEARPFYGQELVSGEGFFAAHYTLPERVIVLLANRSEEPGTFELSIDPTRLPRIAGEWRARFCLNRKGDIGRIGRDPIRVDLPALHDGPTGIELIADHHQAVPPKKS